MRFAFVNLVVAVGCSTAAQPATGPDATRAFYYWRTTFALTPVEERALADLHVSRLYVRVFDVGWTAGHVQPLGPIAVTAPPPPSLEVVPVVFVQNEVLRHAPAADLARDVWANVQNRSAALGTPAPRELQLDCDWTDTTRTAYFELLRELEKQSHVTLTATIRLHQIKYRERTGVPPVARGTLMFYNMGAFSPDPEARSIFDPAAAERYLARVGDYPLPLDVALPIWSWVVHVRDDSVIGLLQSTDPGELASLDFLEPTGDGRYRVTRSTFVHGTFVRAGDLLKVEVTGPDETLAAAAMLAVRLSPQPRTVTLFDLSERNLARHDVASLDRVFQTIH
nr:hypothetical protein [Kofleriaceae bacterium]